MLLLLLLQAWSSEEVGEGVFWKYRHADKQSVSVLEIEIGKKTRIRFADAEGKERTSSLAAKTRAIAAVNGGYFNGKGDAVGLLKIDGKQLGEPNGYPAFGIDASERVLLKPGAGAPHAMAAGPVLVEGGKVRIGDGFAHAKSRHPRTAVGMNGKKLFLVAVDGRAPEASGMTCEELARLMIELGCSWALNLDGGGSTTMWVRGDGVVSYPCDDKKFDHAGERSVANAVLVLAPDVVVGDTDEAKFEGDWKRVKATADHLGADYAVGSGSARWTVKVEFAGTYELFARAPKGGTWRAASLEARPNGSGWVSIGTLKLEAGPLEVEVKGDGVSADAVRIMER